MAQPIEEFDPRVRQYVYDVTVRRGYPPTIAQASSGLGAPLAEIAAAYQRLAEAHMLVLQPGRGEILMASPFSAVPTAFLVELEVFRCFGNCIWDALGIAAMLKKDAHIETACADCGTALKLSVFDDRLQAAEGIVHFALPARRWWDDIVFS